MDVFGRVVYASDATESNCKPQCQPKQIGYSSSLYTLRPVVANSTSMLEKYSYSASIQIRLFNSMSASELEAF
jgi:hypothetical protein